MKSGVSGLYFSLTQAHKSSYEEAQCSELRLVMRIKSDIFNWLQVDDFNKRVMPTAAQQNGCTELSPKEACRLSTGEVIHKYDWSGMFSIYFYLIIIIIVFILIILKFFFYIYNKLNF